MSFNQMNKTQLLEIATLFELKGVDQTWTNGKIRDYLAENKVTYDKYKKAFLEDSEEEASHNQQFSTDQVLVKMERSNPTFEAYGHRFTKSNPYAVMGVQDAQLLFDNFKGFRLASPNEVKKYYS